MKRRFSFRKEATRITVVYLLFGLAWILFSDGFVHLFTVDEETLYKINIVKGWTYVFVTAGLVYYLISRYLQKISQTMDLLHQEIEVRKVAEDRYKSLYEEYENKEVLLLSLLDSIPDLIFYKDTDGVYLGCNTAFEQFVGRPCAQIIGATDHDLFEKEVADSFREMDAAMLSQKQERKNEEKVLYPDGREVYLETLKTPYYDEAGNVLGLIGVSRDISERKGREKEILYLNNTDVLTGLYNRRYFEEAKAKFESDCPVPFSIIMADLNGLKLINDSFGHSKGDTMLIEAGKLLKKYSRSEDIVARIGGDEFCMLLPKTDADTAKSLVQKMHEDSERTSIDIAGTIIKLSISFGQGTMLATDEDLGEIINLAEDSMRRSKLFNRDSTRSDLMASIRATLLEKSHETAEHTQRMTSLAKKIGKELHFSDHLLFELELAADLHDIGKMSVDHRILAKSGKLNDEEWAEIRKHPEVGYRIAQSTSELMPIAEYILSHHERWDGSGYPQGISGEQIPLIARIISIVDAYDAMTEERPYNIVKTEKEACKEICSKAGTQFDPALVKLFVEKIMGHKCQSPAQH